MRSVLHMGHSARLAMPALSKTAPIRSFMSRFPSVTSSSRVAAALSLLQSPHRSLPTPQSTMMILTPLFTVGSRFLSSSNAAESSGQVTASTGAAAPTPIAALPRLQNQADSGKGSPKNLTSDLTLQGPVKGTVEVAVDGMKAREDPHGNWTLPHPLWPGEYVWQVKYTHKIPKDDVDKAAYWTIQAIRFNFDWMSGYSFGKLTERKAVTRIVFLETVAGVPGSIGGILRHLASLRRMKRDGGWIHTLFEEAENERMHLLTFLKIRQPGKFMKLLVFLTQGVFFNFFFVAYLIAPRFCHRLVGYLEEEAVATYTHILHEIDHGQLQAWRTMQAPDIAKTYWHLGENATMRDLVAHVRADEAHHRDVNHRLGELESDQLNPYRSQH